MYATMLAERLTQHNATAWLLNTGWVGGPYPSPSPSHSPSSSQP